MEASTKVTKNSAVAGLATFLLFVLQEIQAIDDLPTWVVALVGGLLVGLGAFRVGYQVTEKKPSPSMQLAVRRRD
jgi:hypothetical protein